MLPAVPPCHPYREASLPNYLKNIKSHNNKENSSHTYDFSYMLNYTYVSYSSITTIVFGCLCMHLFLLM